MNSSAPSATTYCGRQQVLALPTSGWERMVPQQTWLCQSWQQPTWDSWVEVELRHNRWLQSRPCCQIVCLAQLQRMDPLLAYASSTTEVRPCAREGHGFQPIFLSSDDGGITIPTRYPVIDTQYCCSSWFPELGTVLAEMNIEIPLVDLLTLNTAVVTRASGTNDLRFNTGGNGDNSVRIATRHPSVNVSRYAWKRYAFQHITFPLGIGQPRNAAEYSKRINRKIDQAAKSWLTKDQWSRRERTKE